MTGLFDALEQAKQEKAQTEGRPPESPADTRQASLRPHSAQAERTMIGLFQGIQSRLGQDGGKAVEFLGAHRGEGAAPLVRELAKVAAMRLGKSVVLLDADPKRRGQAGLFDVAPPRGWEEAVEDPGAIDAVLHQVGDTGLFVGQLSPNLTLPVFSMPGIDGFLDALRQRFDMVLIDAPPAGTSSDGLAFSARVDGVVLVVESEKTRWQVADEVKERIQRHGGWVLGVVLNKRRHIIPGFIYKRI